MKENIKWTRGRIISVILTLLVMGMIFYFSAGTGETSSGMSMVITRWIITRLFPRFEKLSEARQNGMITMLHYLVRKAAHFTEFAMLGAALRCMLRSFSVRFSWLLAWAAATGYAALDECHQLFVAGRSGQWLDVCVDSAGAAFGAFLAAAIAALIAEHRRNRRTKSLQSQK